jgi:UDP-glucose 4-epimerase
MKGTFLITGGAGFIGSWLAERLAKEGNQVVCIDNFSSYYDPNIKRKNIEPSLKTGNARMVEGDICDYPLLENAVKESGADCIFHLAAQPGIRASVENPQKAYEVNIGGTLSVLRCARKLGVKKVVNASSSSVIGKIGYMPIDEKHPTVPISPYGVSKLSAEHFCRVFSELYGMNIVSLRYFTVYGPRMRPDLAISIFTKKMMGGEPIEVFGDGRQTRDFTFVDDAVDATILASRKGAGVYNIGGGNNIVLNDVIRKLEALTGSKTRIKHTAPMQGDVSDTLADNRKARKELGWNPRTKIDDGLKAYVDWVLSKQA